jgi:UDP-N-acetylglucosamine 2-epimerase (non-hydrolysing)/GDP/UDP-N,N'-diacetylbacillosamine 2-epimerase (hydrolysing)
LPRRRVCFVTGTRAEYGLMRSTLKAIRAHPRLQLQIVATGTHLSHAHGHTVDEISRDGLAVNAAIPWPAREGLAGDAMAAGRQIADALRGLKPHVVLVVGDRVEAFAAAAAAHLNGHVVAHVHGGDRALGQCDDTLRHTITKLSHLHFAATRRSAERIYKLGERREAIHLVGTPGIDDVAPTLSERDWGGGIPPYAVVVLHPKAEAMPPRRDRRGCCWRPYARPRSRVSCSSIRTTTRGGAGSCGSTTA